MNKKPIDSQIESDVGRMLTCAPLNCSKQSSCFRVARFARDVIREMHIENAKEENKYNEPHKKYFANDIFDGIGSWEIG